MTHKNPAKYPVQKIFNAEVGNYAYIVPFIENENHFFQNHLSRSKGNTHIVQKVMSKKKYIDKEEQEIIESYDKGEWNSILTKNREVYVDAAKKSPLKNRRINIRLTEKDYNDIQIKAMEQGIPYQTLISSIIHKYNKGTLKED